MAANTGTETVYPGCQSNNVAQGAFLPFLFDASHALFTVDASVIAPCSAMQPFANVIASTACRCHLVTVTGYQASPLCHDTVSRCEFDIKYMIAPRLLLN